VEYIDRCSFRFSHYNLNCPPQRSMSHCCMKSPSRTASEITRHFPSHAQFSHGYAYCTPAISPAEGPREKSARITTALSSETCIGGVDPGPLCFHATSTLLCTVAVVSLTPSLAQKNDGYCIIEFTSCLKLCISCQGCEGPSGLQSLSLWLSS
jgi:hypothetical protein